MTRASAEPALDAESCRILRERGRFRPGALPAEGELYFRWFGGGTPGAGAVRGEPLAIERRVDPLPGEFEAAVAADGGQGSAALEVEVSDRGAPLRCTIAPDGRAIGLARLHCAEIMRGGVFIPASDGAGGRRSGIYRLTVTWVQI